MPSSLHHLIIGGQRSGKSRQAERMARQWLVSGSGREVAVVATALACDAEMQARIDRHRADRPLDMATIEEPLHLSQALQREARTGRMLVVDCLMLWLTNWLMPASGDPDPSAWEQELQALLAVLPHLPSPVVFVSNEVGWGVIPMSKEVRQFVDELGRLNQAVAQSVGEVTLMVAGQAWRRPASA